MSQWKEPRISYWQDGHKPTANDANRWEENSQSACFVIGTSYNYPDTVLSRPTVGNVDYLCDGTDDQVEINAAIAALPSSGGKIIIREGTYNITSAVNLNKSNVTIAGMGRSTILKRMYNEQSFGGVITVTAHETIIKDLQVYGNKYFHNSTGNMGVFIDAVHANQVLNCTFYSSGGGGVRLLGSMYNSILNNHCDGNTMGGIDLIQSHENRVLGNFVGNGNAYGIFLQGASENAISGNVLFCVDLPLDLISSSDNTISSNTITSCSNGISLQSGLRNIILGNILKSIQLSCISVNFLSDTNVITGNYCNGGNESSTGINLSGKMNKVTGNYCYENAAGISLNADMNTITGNCCYENSTGIVLVGASMNTIVGNSVMRGTGQQEDYSGFKNTILILPASPIPPSNHNLVTNNLVMGCPVVQGAGHTGNLVENNKWN